MGQNNWSWFPLNTCDLQKQYITKNRTTISKSSYQLLLSFHLAHHRISKSKLSWILLNEIMLSVSPVIYKNKMTVQGLDPETKHWLVAVVIDTKKNSCKVTWPGYAKAYSCWLELEDMRLPVPKRALLNKNAIANSKTNFPKRGDPKDL